MQLTRYPGKGPVNDTDVLAGFRFGLFVRYI